jgi:AcrR family transcriptional regulator
MARETGRDGSATRERILEAAAEVIAQRGYEAANVEEIVRRATASKGAFYFHFPSKEEMVLALVDRLSARLVEKVRRAIRDLPPSRRRLERAVEVLLETFARKRLLGQLLLVNIVGHGRSMDRKFLPVRRRFHALIREELEAALRAGILPEATPTELAARVWLGALHEVILNWLLADDPEPLPSQAPALCRLLLDGVAGRGEG